MPRRVVTVAGNVDAEAALAQEVSRERNAELVLRCLDRTELLAAVRGARVDLVLVVGSPGWFDLSAVAEIAERGVRVIGFAADPLEAEVLRGLGVQIVAPGAQIADILAPDQESEPAPALPQQTRPGRLIAVWGPKGAPGRSTVAAELAVEIAATERSTALIDADTYGGDLAQMFAVVEEIPTIIWAAQSAADARLDSRTIATLLRRIGEDGPVFLPGINRSELWSDITRYGWGRVLETFSSSFAFSVVDVGFGIELDERSHHERDRIARQTIARADHVVAVCRADPIGLKTFLWAIEKLFELADRDDVVVAANKVAPREADEVKYILKKHLGKRPAICLPVRHADARSAIDRGAAIRDVRPNGEFTSSIRDLAASVGAHVPARGLLTRLGGRR